MSRPGNKRLGFRGASDDVFWSVVVIVVFTLALYLLAMEALSIAGIDASSRGILPKALVFVVALALVLLPLILYGSHPRTRSGTATTTFTLMKSFMLLAGIILFIGGASNAFETNGFDEQVTLALLALFYVVTPLSLHLSRR